MTANHVNLAISLTIRKGSKLCCKIRDKDRKPYIEPPKGEISYPDDDNDNEERSMSELEFLGEKAKPIGTLATLANQQIRKDSLSCQLLDNREQSVTENAVAADEDCESGDSLKVHRDATEDQDESDEDERLPVQLKEVKGILRKWQDDLTNSTAKTETDVGDADTSKEWEELFRSPEYIPFRPVFETIEEDVVGENGQCAKEQVNPKKRLLKDLPQWHLDYMDYLLDEYLFQPDLSKIAEWDEIYAVDWSTRNSRMRRPIKSAECGEADVRRLEKGVRPIGNDSRVHNLQTGTSMASGYLNRSRTFPVETAISDYGRERQFVIKPDPKKQPKIPDPFSDPPERKPVNRSVNDDQYQVDSFDRGFSEWRPEHRVHNPVTGKSVARNYLYRGRSYPAEKAIEHFGKDYTVDMLYDKHTEQREKNRKNQKYEAIIAEGPPIVDSPLSDAVFIPEARPYDENADETYYEEFFEFQPVATPQRTLRTHVKGDDITET